MSLDRKEEKKNPSSCDTKRFTPLLQNNIEYSISINPLGQFEESSSRYIDWYSSVVTFLKKHKVINFCYLYLNTEISYPLKNGVEKRKPETVISRLHLHGTILFKDVVKWFIYVQPFLASFCIYEIDIINNEDTWNNYIHKDTRSWEESMPDPCLPNQEACTRIEPFTEYNICNRVIKNSKVKRKKKDVNRMEEIVLEPFPLLTEENQCQFYCEVDSASDQVNQSNVLSDSIDESSNNPFILPIK